MALFDKESIYEIIKASKEITPLAEQDGWTISDVIVKLNEETGEFAEASLIKQGKITSKGSFEYEADYEEAADVIICVVDALTRLNPETNQAFIYTKLLKHLDQKRAKWVNKVKGEHKNDDAA